jgi:hypothetical protein
MENRYSFPLKRKVPSPQLTPTPAAIEVLWIATLPTGPSNIRAIPSRSAGPRKGNNLRRLH